MEQWSLVKKALVWFGIAMVFVYPFAYCTANGSTLAAIVLFVSLLGCLVRSAYFVLKAEDAT